MLGNLQEIPPLGGRLNLTLWINNGKTPHFHTLRHIPTHPDTSRHIPTHPDTSRHISNRNLQTIQTPNQKSNPKRLEQRMKNECCCSIRQRGSCTLPLPFFNEIWRFLTYFDVFWRSLKTRQALNQRSNLNKQNKDGNAAIAVSLNNFANNLSKRNKQLFSF